MLQNMNVALSSTSQPQKLQYLIDVFKDNVMFEKRAQVRIFGETRLHFRINQFL